jgi:hypothetical protein
MNKVTLTKRKSDCLKVARACLEEARKRVVLYLENNGGVFDVYYEYVDCHELLEVKQADNFILLQNALSSVNRVLNLLPVEEES